MPIVTLAEVKQILNISDASKDNAITALIPAVQTFIIGYCHNFFKVPDVYVQNSDISFDAVAKKIKDSVNSEFVSSGFRQGMDIAVEGSMNNDGVYSISAIAAGEITVAETLIDEDDDYWVKITRVRFPQSLKRTAAKLIDYDLKIKNGLSSESIGDYSAAFSGEYPKSLLDELIIYRKIPW